MKLNKIKNERGKNYEGDFMGKNTEYWLNKYVIGLCQCKYPCKTWKQYKKKHDFFECERIERCVNYIILKIEEKMGNTV